MPKKKTHEDKKHKEPKEAQEKAHPRHRDSTGMAEHEQEMTEVPVEADMERKEPPKIDEEQKLDSDGKEKSGPHGPRGPRGPHKK